MNDKTGRARALKATPEQIASLESMYLSGDIVSGETVLVLGKDTALDESSVRIPEDMSVKDRIHLGSERSGPSHVVGVSYIVHGMVLLCHSCLLRSSLTNSSLCRWS